MNEFDDLRRAWGTMKTELREAQPFKALYAVAVWILDRLTAGLERRK